MVMRDFGQLRKPTGFSASASARAMALAPSSAWVFAISHSSAVSLPGLSRMLSGNADLADVVQRCRLRQGINGGVVEHAGKARVLLQGFWPGANVFLRPAQVVAGFRVAGFGQPGQGVDADLLDELVSHACAAPLLLRDSGSDRAGCRAGLEIELGADAESTMLAAAAVM